MLLFLLLGVYAGAAFLNGICLKKDSNVLRGGTTDQPVYVLINATIACLFFAALNGFSIHINAVTWCYAAAFSVIVLAALLLSLAVYRYASIPTVSVIRSTLTLIVTSALGTLFFSEELPWITVVRVALLVVASVLIYLSQLTGNPREDGEASGVPHRSARERLAFWIIMALLVADVCATTLLTKSFALRTDVSDERSYYFATNLILFVMGAVWLLLVGRGKLREVTRGLRDLSPKNYVVIVVQTVSSNLISLLAVPLTAMLAVASYSAYTSAISVVAAAAASLCFRERQNVFSVASIFVALASFLIGAL